MRLYVDIETYSAIDLTKCGAPRYASDESTGINCIAYAIDDQPIHVLKYAEDEQIWGLLIAADTIVAHNCAFERTILAERSIGQLRTLQTYSRLAYSKWSDTMARAAYYGYPRSLDGVAKALKLPLLKDVQGKTTMKKLMTGIYTPEDCPEDFERLYSYCRTDVEVTRLIDKALPELPPEVHAQFMLDMEINDRGVPIDLTMIGNAIMLKNKVEMINDHRMALITGETVTAVSQATRLKEWVIAQGVDMVDITADTVAKTLAKPLPDNVRAALELRQEAGLSSLSKYESMRNYAVGSRLYQMHDFYGAHTGRPTGNGPQVLNLARSEHPEFWAEAVMLNPDFVLESGRPAEKLKQALRGSICAPPGKVLLGCDLAQIEARATGWVSNEQKFLHLFLASDPYCTYGSKIFNRTITKKDNPIERTASKASMLSLGFAGGIGAYQRVAENYKIDFRIVAEVILPTATPAEYMEAERCYEYYLKKGPLKPLSFQEGVAVDIVKQRYRRDFPLIVAYWDQLEQAFLMGGEAGPIHIEVKPSRLRIITLPSGRQLFYHDVRSGGLSDDPDAEPNSRAYHYQGRRGRKFLWKGTLIENVAQAINADISDWYKIRANKIGGVVHHCYDEFTLEVDERDADRALNAVKELTQTMKPKWCLDLPLGFDYWVGTRYGK